MQNYLSDNSRWWESEVQKCQRFIQGLRFQKWKDYGKMFIIFLKITIQKEFAAEYCFKMDASILRIHDAISVPLKMLAINEDVNSVRRSLTNLNVITQRCEIWAIHHGLQYTNILLFKIRNSRQRYVLEIVNHKVLRSHEKWTGNLKQSYGCGDISCFAEVRGDWLGLVQYDTSSLSTTAVITRK